MENLNNRDKLCNPKSKSCVKSDVKSDVKSCVKSNAKKNSLKYIFETRANNILYDPNIFDHILIEYLTDFEKQFAYIGYPQHEKWIADNYSEYTEVDQNQNYNIVKKTFLNGVLNSINDNPAKHKFFNEFPQQYNTKNIPYSKRWYKDGKEHRYNDLPAIVSVAEIEIDDSLFYHYELAWFFNGVLHRDDNKYAKSYYDHETNFMIFEWYKNGILHNDDDEPSEISISCDTKTICSAIWYKNGLKHRDADLPAELFYNDGRVEVAMWYQNNKFYRDNNLPTHIEFSDDEITLNWFFTNGELLGQKQLKTLIFSNDDDFNEQNKYYDEKYFSYINSETFVLFPLDLNKSC